MNVVDSSGWLEYFSDGKNAQKFSAPLQDVDNLIVPTITIFEVFKVVFRERGESDALQAIAAMKQGTVADLSSEIAMQSAKASHELGIPMADSIILTTARTHNATVWTQDDHFKGFDDCK